MIRYAIVGAIVGAALGIFVIWATAGALDLLGV